MPNDMPWKYENKKSYKKQIEESITSKIARSKTKVAIFVMNVFFIFAEYDKQKLSNFYILNESKRFVMSDIQGSEPQNIEGIDRHGAANSHYRLSYGIIDGWRGNENHKSLLLTMKISGITNDDAAALIKEIVDPDQKTSKGSNHPDVWAMDQRQNMDVDAHQDDHDLHAIFIKSTAKLSLKTIAQKLCLTAVKVSKVIRDYKETIRSQLETNSKRAAKARNKIGEDGLGEVKKFWAENIHWPIWVDDVKKAVWGSEEIERLQEQWKED